MTMRELDKSDKELRLGLVLYGGVSLAIYMHGMTRELHKLVLASRAYELHRQDPARNMRSHLEDTSRCTLICFASCTRKRVGR